MTFARVVTRVLAWVLAVSGAIAVIVGIGTATWLIGAGLVVAGKLLDTPARRPSQVGSHRFEVQFAPRECGTKPAPTRS